MNTQYYKIGKENYHFSEIQNMQAYFHTVCDVNSSSKLKVIQDLLEVQESPITRFKSKKLQEAILGLIKFHAKN